MGFAPIIVAIVLAAGAAPAPGWPFDRTGADPVAHGARLAAVLGCTGCHGAALTGEDWSEPGFIRLWTSNLTRTVPDYSDAQLRNAIRSGVRQDGTPLWGMPSHLFTQLGPADIAALTAFLRNRPPAGTAHPRPVLEDGARREIAAGSFRSSVDDVRRSGGAWPPDAGARFARGRAIVRATCAECHGMDLRGGPPHPGAAARPDLRMVAAYDAAQLRQLLQTGVAIGGREVGLMSQVSRGRFRHLTEAERGAVHAYLQRVAKVAP
ncbi:cytochrome c [Polymorphobacter fuscus]|uniref:C-type cytochrome n=1 Tax=Sandarakinorhabdus fusca TaxID=1439888 RepID=A0A7C9KJZ2_9SPHN|nr:cytochrome c [Polymorphobacter fuscus]KAB7643715.1 cytochrome c [Polymorphobacter fuscus]MQT18660.1 c-type cytochrome [Polymorphobacter fuscus]NJC08124.1 mono/diheme cytochrome c family protein [Polymorphobacter fuscus]